MSAPAWRQQDYLEKRVRDLELQNQVLQVECALREGPESPEGMGMTGLALGALRAVLTDIEAAIAISSRRGVIRRRVAGLEEARRIVADRISLVEGGGW